MNNIKNKADDKKNSENILLPKIVLLPLGYEDEECEIERKVAIKEITAWQMLRITDVVKEAMEKSEEIGQEQFNQLKNNMDLNNKILAIAISHPDKNKNEIDFEKEIEKSMKIIQFAPQDHIDNANKVFYEMNNLSDFLARNLFGVLQTTAFKISTLSRTTAKQQEKDLANSLKFSQRNTVGEDGK